MEKQHGETPRLQPGEGKHLPAPSTKCHRRGHRQGLTQRSPNQRVSAVPAANSWSTASPLTCPLLDRYSSYPSAEARGTALPACAAAEPSQREKPRGDSKRRRRAQGHGCCWHRAAQPPVPHGSRTGAVVGGLTRAWEACTLLLITSCSTASFGCNRSGCNTTCNDLLDLKNDWKNCTSNSS